MKVDTARLRRKLDAARENVPDAAQRAVRECAEDLLDTAMPGVPLSVKRYPSDPAPGELRQSGYVDHDTHPDGSEVGFSAPYAYIVHELGIEFYKGYDINWSTPGTGAKYLEKPFVANKGRYAKYVKDEARRALRD